MFYSFVPHTIFLSLRFYFVLIFGMLLPIAVNAQQLSGTVYFGGEPLAQAEITVFDGTNSIVLSTLTDISGAYAVELGSGTYDIIVSPPVTLGLSETLIEGVVIDQQDVLYHFVLLRPEVVVSGVVKSASGVPVGGVELAIYNQNTGLNVGYLMTDSSGSYSFPVAQGAYRIIAFGYGRNANVALPEYWKIDPLIDNLDLQQDQSLDLSVPNIAMNGTVTSRKGDAVPDVALSIRQDWWNGGRHYYLQYNGNTVKTDSNGNYSIGVFDNAQYDVSLSPPVDSGYANTVIAGNQVSGNTRIDFTVDDATYLSGTVLTPAGMPVSGVELTVINAKTNSFMGRMTTAEQGTYVFPLRPGEYKIFANGHGQNSNITLPRQWEISPLVDKVTLSVNRTLDLVLPMVRLSGTVTDGSGDPQANVAMELAARWQTENTAFASVIDNNYIQTNQAGEFDFYTIVYDNYSLNLVPAEDSQQVTTQYPALAITQDTVRDFSLSGASRIFGMVITPEGHPVEGVTLSVIDQTTNMEIKTIKTGADGLYEFPVAPGLYKIDAWSNNSSSQVNLPQVWGIKPVLKNLLINGIHEHNIVLPLVQISGRVYDSQGRPVGGAKVKFESSWVNDGTYFYVNNAVNNSLGELTSDENGYYTALVFAHDNYRIELTPPANQDLLDEVIEGVNATESRTQDLAFAPAFGLEGLVRDTGGRPVAGVNLDFINRETRVAEKYTTSDGQGRYHMALREGRYDIHVSEPRSASNASFNLPLPDRFSMAPVVRDYALATDSSLDIVLPLVTLSGKAIDSNGVAVPNVQLLVSERWKQNGISFSVNAYGNRFKTNAMGEYAIALFPYANYSQQIIPPKASGFTAAEIDGFTIERDSLQDIILSFPDSQAPLIVAGPHVTQITDATALVQWETSESTLGSITYGPGNRLDLLATGVDYRRSHSMPLTDLLPATTYSLRVSADDFNNNGPVSSKTVEFTTLAISDTQTPIMLEGPSVTAITEDSATLSWTTNEPTRATLRFGTASADTPSSQDLTDSLSVETTNTHHEVVLQGLQADMAYTVLVEAQDAAGNGPVQSPLKSFFTLAKADTAPPMIIAGPLVSDISEQGAIILWETDGPATSGVSYNDGSHHGIVSDDALVTLHSVVLTQLAPGTLYRFTVSSSDGSGNGPTLSEQQEFTTQMQSDQQPPLIIQGPDIINITHQSVVIRWQTDEAADSVIDYGLSREDMGLQEARSALVTNHNLPITGLAPETTYYFRVSSADVYGNRSAVSDIYSFTTNAKGANSKPTITSEPSIIQLSDSTATVYWETDIAADSLVRYGTAEKRLSKESPGKSRKHQITLTGLQPDSEYQLSVASRNPESTDHFEADSQDISVRTHGQMDTLAPEITGPVLVKVLDDATVEIHWQTDEIADSRVQFNVKGDSLSKSTGSLSRRTEHTVTLTHLNNGEIYQFRIFSQDIQGNRYQSAEMEFTTKEDSDHNASDNQGSQGSGVVGLVPAMALLFYLLLVGRRRSGHKIGL